MKKNLEEFKEAVEAYYKEDVLLVIKNALDLKYPMEDMLRILAYHIKATKDPMSDVEMFVADGEWLGIDLVVSDLKSILADTVWFWKHVGEE